MATPVVVESFVGKLSIPLIENYGGSDTTTRTFTVEEPVTVQSAIETAITNVYTWLNSNPVFIQPASWTDDTQNDSQLSSRVYRYDSQKEIGYEIINTRRIVYSVDPVARTITANPSTFVFTVDQTFDVQLTFEGNAIPNVVYDEQYFADVTYDEGIKQISFVTSSELPAENITVTIVLPAEGIYETASTTVTFTV